MSVAGISDEWVQAVKRRFEAIASQWRHKYPDLQLELETPRGHPVDGLTTLAESTGASLLVVGGRRRHHLTAVLLGSVARGVLHHATCPVAVVHGPKATT
jgi:nucleotide-binding universal stress UspA family protein